MAFGEALRGIAGSLGDLYLRREGLPTAEDIRVKRAAEATTAADTVTRQATARTLLAKLQAELADQPAAQAALRGESEARTDELRSRAEERRRLKTEDPIDVALRRRQAEADIQYKLRPERPRPEDRILVSMPTGEFDEEGNPVYQMVPRSQAAGKTFSKPNLTERKARVEGQLAREAMSTNLDTIQKRLDEVKGLSGTSAITSPVKAYNVRKNYKATVQNLAVAANRVLGDTSGRYSDADRKVAADLLGVSNEILLIADPEIAQERLNAAREAIERMGAVQRQIRPGPGESREAGGQAGGLTEEENDALDALKGLRK